MKEKNNEHLLMTESCSSARLRGNNRGDVSWINETNMKERQREHVTSWLICNPNSEEFPPAEGESCVVSSVG